MDTIQVMEVAGSLELKYCEFCGALWMRPRGSVEPYCPRCTRWIETELPRLAQGEA